MRATQLKNKLTALLPGALLALALFLASDFSSTVFADESIDIIDSSQVSEHDTDSNEHATDPHDTDEDSTSVGHATEEHAAEEHGGEHSGEHGDEAHAEGGHELPNLIGMIFGHKANPTITDIQYWENVIFALLAGLFLVIVAQRVHANRQMIPGKLQNLVEMLVEYFYDFFHSILGDQTKRFMPFLGTLFFYILTMNFMGMIPGLKAASSSINITASLALLTFCYAQFVGFKELGFKGWADHLLGSPRDVVGWAMVPLLLPIHIIGELAKPFSLAVRLFGNITGEDVLIFAFVGLGLSITASMGLDMVGLPLQIIFIPLAILFSTIQALVFTVLSTIYIAMMLPHGDSH